MAPRLPGTIEIVVRGNLIGLRCAPAQSMVRKSGYRFSEKTMLKQKAWSGKVDTGFRKDHARTKS
jgi:hypothetical protein